MAIYKTNRHGDVNLFADDVHCYHNPDVDGIRIEWSTDGIGFGECDVVFNSKDGRTMEVRTEHMADNEHKEFLRALFSDLVDQLKVVE